MSTAQDQQWVDVVGMLVSKFLIPIGVAFIAYIAFDMWGEWRKRRKYSRLGVAIIEALQEEIRHGIEQMWRHVELIDAYGPRPPLDSLPKKSWNGMSTIPDGVLLRIIETSSKLHYEEFQPKDCRIHCKNYFEHMCDNYNRAIDQAIELTQKGQDWRPPFLLYLDGGYIEAAKQVNQMLQNAKDLLEKNSRAWFPK